jgi:ADP-ribosylglycohydrolase
MAVGGLLGGQRPPGSPYEQLSRYSPQPPAMRALPELDLQFMWADVLARSGRPNSPHALGAAYKRSPRTYEDAAAFAHNNLQRGFVPPSSGAAGNPLCESFAPAARTQIWACVSPGDPAEAARLAAHASVVDHGGEAVFAAMFIAACQASAFVVASIPKIIAIGLKMIPFDCKVANCVRAAVNAFQSDGTGDQARTRIERAAGPCDYAYAPLNAGFFVYALLAGGREFGGTIAAAASMGGSAREVTGAAGSLIGVLEGADAISDEWRMPVGDTLIHGWDSPRFEVPESFSAWSRTVEGLARRLEREDAPSRFGEEPPGETLAGEGVGEAQPEGGTEGQEGDAETPPEGEQPEETGGEEVGAAADPYEPLYENARCEPCWSLAPHSQIFEEGEFRVTFQWQEPPFVGAVRSNRLRVLIENLGTEDVAIEPTIAAPKDWVIAFRTEPALLRPGSVYEQCAVIRCPTDVRAEQTSRVVLSFAGHEVSGVLLRPRGWLTVGPFRNDEGTGFDKHHKAEDIYDREHVFTTRSGLIAQWHPVYFEGPEMPVEGAFMAGPGVQYYRTILTSDQERKVRLVAATDDGVVVWVNRRRLLWYHHHHTAQPRARHPYAVQADVVAGDNELLLKVVRCKEPIRGLWFYVLAEDSSIPTDMVFDEARA